MAVFEFGIVPSEDGTECATVVVRSLDGGVVEADNGAGGRGGYCHDGVGSGRGFGG